MSTLISPFVYAMKCERVRLFTNRTQFCLSRWNYLRGIELKDVSVESKSCYENKLVEEGAESRALLNDLLIIPPDLARLVELWDNLPDTVKGDILALAEFSTDLPNPPRHKTT